MGVKRFKPAYPGEFPTLGHDVLDWMTDYLAMPDKEEYTPYTPTREQAEFILNLYRLDPVTGKRVVRRGVISRPKGWGKSPFLSSIAIAEGLAPVMFDGWDAYGRPVGKPWSRIRTPLVHLLAVSESQTANAWAPLLEMVRQGPVVDAYPGVEPMDTRVNLPTGAIEFRTSSGTSYEGAKPIFCILDQTESWTPSNGGVKLAAVARRNLTKTGGVSIEAPNAFEPGADSVAEESAKYHAQIRDGNAREEGLLYDHREWPDTTDLEDADSIKAGLAVAYGADLDACVIHDPPCTAETWSRGWVDLDRVQAEIWDPATLVSDAARFFGNKAHADADAFVAEHEWNAALAGEDVPDVTPEDPVVLGFDGSRHRKKGVTDATALVAMRAFPGIDATRLSAIIAFDRSTLGSVIERLEAKGFVERKPGPDDKRIKLLYLTKAGATELRNVEPAVAAAQARMLAPLKPADRKTLLALMTQLVDLNNDSSRVPLRADHAIERLRRAD